MKLPRLLLRNPDLAQVKTDAADQDLAWQILCGQSTRQPYPPPCSSHQPTDENDNNLSGRWWNCKCRYFGPGPPSGKDRGFLTTQWSIVKRIIYQYADGDGGQDEWCPRLREGFLDFLCIRDLDARDISNSELLRVSERTVVEDFFGKWRDMDIVR